MENSAVCNSDKYISISKLIFQLVNGKVNLKRLPNIHLQKSLSTSGNASKINNVEEDKENQSNFHLHQDESDGDIKIKNNCEYLTIRREDGGAPKELMSAYCKDCDKDIVGIDDTYIKCEECDKKYSIFKCGKCKWNYSNYRSLRTHLYKVCNPLTEYQCCYCDYKCYRTGEIQFHVLKHRLPSSLEDLEKTELQLQDAQIRCDLCPFTTSLKRHLLIHLRAKHPETVVESPSEVKPTKIQCPKCGKVFMNSTGLREHKEFCQKLPNIQCQYCPRRTYRTSMMKQHMKKMHPKFMPAGSNRKRDKRPKKKEHHVINSRMMVKRFCKDCKRPYKNPNKRAVCLSCKGELHYACKKCGVTFPNYNKVKNHVRYSCFGRTTYYCRQCDSSRSSKEFILNHISKAHGDDWIR